MLFSLQDLIFLTKDQTQVPAVKVLSPNHCTTNEFSVNALFFFNVTIDIGIISVTSKVPSSSNIG